MHPAPPWARFEHLQVEDSLPHREAGVIIQDIMNLFIGTQNGINNCDDQVSSTLCYEPNDETDLRFVFIESILEDSDGSLLVSTQTGYTEKDSLWIAERRVAVKTRWMMILLLVLLLTLAGCDISSDESAIDTSVAATLEATEIPDSGEPTISSAPDTTDEIGEEPTPLSPTKTQEAPVPMSDEDAIKAALAAYLGKAEEELTITVSDIKGNLARGGLQGAYFIAAKDAGEWFIAYAGQATPYCNVINPYNFPATWVPECLAEDDTLVQRSETEGSAILDALGSPTWTDTMDSQGRWYLVNTDTTTFSMEGGNLVMHAHEAGGYDEWGIAVGADQTDFYIEVSARAGDQCSGLDRYGVIFRVPDPSQGVVFTFSCDGRYRLYEWDGEKYTGIQEWRADSSIISGPDEVNRQGIMVVGDQVKLYANDRLLGEYTIEDYSQGRFGLVVGSSDTDNFKVMIDSVSFWNLADN